MPGFWKQLHAGDLSVHRTSIHSLASSNTVRLTNGSLLPTDLVILCTGWTDNLDPFDASLRAEIGVPSPADLSSAWTKLDREADARVDQLLPNLHSIPHETSTNPQLVPRRPWRLYRRMVSPILADRGDRSIVFLGQIHTVYTPMVAEMQSLWASAFLLDQLPVPSMECMKQEIALWNSWTAKRYLAQGRKHSYSIYDYLAYIDSIGRDLGIRTNRKSNPISELFATYRPSDYRGIIDEYLDARRTQLEKQGGEKNTAGTSRVKVLWEHEMMGMYALTYGVGVAIVLVLLIAMVR